MVEQGPLHLSVPFNAEFYRSLIAARDTFRPAWSHSVPRGAGYGFRVQAGQAFRLVQEEAAQILDTCFSNADDPREHYHATTQLALEGTQITRLTRVWGTPPQSRPLCTCTADTVRPQANPGHTREHGALTAHCNPHMWMLYSGTHPRTCYDNLRAGYAMLGLSQRSIHDNINMFQNTGLDPVTGDYPLRPGNAEAGDYIEFYAEVPLAVVISLCPDGAGAIPVEEWGQREVPVYPVRVEVYDTGVQPLGWPY